MHCKKLDSDVRKDPLTIQVFHRPKSLVAVQKTVFFSKGDAKQSMALKRIEFGSIDFIYIDFFLNKRP